MVYVMWKAPPSPGAAGTRAYQLAVVVDDAAQGVTEVVRGDDLIPSTPRQLLLYQALGLAAPSLCHMTLVVESQRCWDSWPGRAGGSTRSVP
jgi:glutamyl-tRNA synthetase